MLPLERRGFGVTARIHPPLTAVSTTARRVKCAWHSTNTSDIYEEELWPMIESIRKEDSSYDPDNIRPQDTPTPASSKQTGLWFR